MTTIGLVMAGGFGTRMKDSGISTPKPLVKVGEQTLIESAIQWQAEAGVSAIRIAVREEQFEVRSVVRALGTARSVRQAPIKEIVEETPLGNLGALILLRDQADRILVSFADNVSRLDAQRFKSFHETGGYDASIAVHRASIRFPYGVVSFSSNRVRNYEEKPEIERWVCSGFGIYETAALGGFATGDSLGMCDVTSTLLEDGASVGAFLHDSPWVDVNTAQCVLTAEACSAARCVTQTTTGAKYPGGSHGPI